VRFILALATIGLVSSSCLAQTAQIDRIDIVSYGVYTADVSEPGVSSEVGQNILSTNIKHAATTKVVPAEIGVRFGFEFAVVGSPNDADVNLTKVTIFPPAGVKVPDKGAVHRDHYDVAVRIGGTSYSGYRFDHDWELVPGTWTLQLWDGKRRLASMSFKVVRK
jgi:hypothetical protein